jgi:hypothetical protein
MNSKEIETAMRLLEELFKTMNGYLKEYDNSQRGDYDAFALAKSNYQWIRRYYENLRTLEPRSFDNTADFRTQALFLIDLTGLDDEAYPAPQSAKNKVRQLLDDLMPGEELGLSDETLEMAADDLAETTAMVEEGSSRPSASYGFGVMELLYGWIPFFGYPMALYWFSQKKKKRASFFVAYSTIGILSMVYLMR